MATKLTLGRVKEFTLRAAKDSGLTGVSIVDAKWLAPACIVKPVWKDDVPQRVRIARVTVEQAGRTATKFVTVRDNGSVDVK